MYRGAGGIGVLVKMLWASQYEMKGGNEWIERTCFSLLEQFVVSTWIFWVCCPQGSASAPSTLFGFIFAGCRSSG